MISAYPFRKSVGLHKMILSRVIKAGTRLTAPGIPSCCPRAVLRCRNPRLRMFERTRFARQSLSTSTTAVSSSNGGIRTLTFSWCEVGMLLPT